MNFKLKLISHACVFVDLGEVKLLTDPWLFGNCFNDGWSLKKANLCFNLVFIAILKMF